MVDGAAGKVLRQGGRRAPASKWRGLLLRHGLALAAAAGGAGRCSAGACCGKLLRERGGLGCNVQRLRGRVHSRCGRWKVVGRARVPGLFLCAAGRVLVPRGCTHRGVTERHGVCNADTLAATNGDAPGARRGGGRVLAAIAATRSTHGGRRASAAVEALALLLSAPRHHSSTHPPAGWATRHACGCMRSRGARLAEGQPVLPRPQRCPCRYWGCCWVPPGHCLRGVTGDGGGNGHAGADKARMRGCVHATTRVQAWMQARRAPHLLRLRHPMRPRAR